MERPPVPRSKLKKLNCPPVVIVTLVPEVKLTIEGTGLPTLKPLNQLPVVADTVTPLSVMLVNGSRFTPPRVSNVTVAPAADPIVVRTMLILIRNLCIGRVVGFVLR